MTKQVPFYANTSDDTHCYQAAIRMVLKYFLPDSDFTWEELEKLSAKLPGKSTWPQQMLISLKDMGFNAILVEGFDARAFIKDGSDYLKREFGEETANWQIKNSDIDQERKIYQSAYDKGVKIETRIPEIAEIKKYLDDGYLIICTINSRKLNSKPGYVGHAVVIYDMDDDHIKLHDPGLPPQEGRKVSINEFEDAWSYPNEKAKNFKAIKPSGATK